MTRVDALDEYKLMLTSEKKIECEGIFHYLLKNNNAKCIRKILKYNFNYTACNISPFERLSCDTVSDFIHYLKTVVDRHHDYQILMNMTSTDIMALVNAPESLVVEFFELFEITDKQNFEKQRTNELHHYNYIHGFARTVMYRFPSVEK